MSAKTAIKEYPDCSLVSIVVPMYNSEKTIRRCLESILHQDYDDYEIIVVDDGSSDESLSEVKKIKDSRIKVYPMAHGGVSAARNYGLDKASGKYLMFLDSDDEIEPGAISTLVEYASNNKAKVIKFLSYDVSNGAKSEHVVTDFTDNVYLLSKKKDKQELLDLFFRRQCVLPCFTQTLFVESSLIKTNKIRFDTTKYIMEDVIFHLDILRVVDKVHTVKLYLHDYNDNSESVTKNKKHNHRNVVGLLDSIWVVLGRIGNDKKVAARYVKIVYGYLAGEKDDGEVFYEDTFSEKMCELAKLADMQGEMLFWKAVKWAIVHKQRAASKLLAEVYLLKRALTQRRGH